MIVITAIQIIFKIAKKFTFKNPKPSTILIYDCEGSKILIDTILYDFDYSVLPARGEFFYYSPKILLIMSKKIFEFKFTQSKKISFDIDTVYFLSCIEYINPKIVITFIDNSGSFQWLSKNYTRAVFYALQNGWRNKLDLYTWRLKPDGTISHITMSNFLCFGQCDVDNYIKYGHTIDVAHCVGSLKGCYYKYSMNKGPVKIEYDVCLVSQYSPGVFKENTHPYLKEPLENVHFLLNSYLEKNPLRACVALRSSEQDEYEYYENLFSNKVTIIPRDAQKDMFSTYRAMDSSEVVITWCSTAALEAFGWGKKMLFCNFSGDEIAEFFYRYQFSVQNPDLNEFEDKLNSLLETKNEDFLRLTEKDRHYVMNYDPNMPVHIYMRNIIKDLRDN